MNNVMFIKKEYLKNFNDNVYIKTNMDDEFLAEIWKNFNWKKAEENLLKMQCTLSKIAYKRDMEGIKKIQKNITNSTVAKMIAVRKVSEECRNVAGVDGVRWRSSSEKMRAAIRLTENNYKSKPYKHFVFKDVKCNKERELGVPTMYDRAIQVLFSFALEPISEAWADRRSFSARKGRSIYTAHAILSEALSDNETGDWILMADVKSYYDTIWHQWILENIPMNKKVLREILKCGMCYEDGTVELSDEGISLGSNLSPILGNMVLDGLQKELYNLQKDVVDYKNGWCLRFADDIIVLARTRDDAENFKKVIEIFCEKRGLRLNEKKTKIINIKKGIDFLSRVYIKINGTLRVIPSEIAVKNFEKELIEFTSSYNKDNWSQRKFIKELNIKLRRMGCVS